MEPLASTVPEPGTTLNTVPFAYCAGPACCTVFTVNPFCCRIWVAAAWLEAMMFVGTGTPPPQIVIVTVVLLAFTCLSADGSCAVTVFWVPVQLASGLVGY